MRIVLDFRLARLTGLPRWSAAQARAVLTAQRDSGLCVAHFARRHRLDPARLYRARARLLTHHVPPSPSLFLDVTAALLAHARRPC